MGYWERAREKKRDKETDRELADTGKHCWLSMDALASNELLWYVVFVVILRPELWLEQESDQTQ